MKINAAMNSIDEITMRLVHYFITKENYQPIIVKGLDNEIWLENTEKHYNVIRINSNYIHNNEQLEFDTFKLKNVVKQIKRKTFTFSCNTLNILLNIGDNVTKTDASEKHLDICRINSVEELNNNSKFSKIFPEIKNDIIEAKNEMDFFINVTNDINETTEKKNKVYEKTFMKKIPIITYILIAINIIIWLLCILGIINYRLFQMNTPLVKAGEYYRMFTAPFMHAGLLHLACNMYSLYVLGTQLETVMGKIKYLVVYLISALFGVLLSGVINPILNPGVNIFSFGASGAIFGLMGALTYFGYHYRLYFGNVVLSKIIPLILLNLMISFSFSSIDAFGHLGGLVGGAFIAMAVGVEGKSEKSSQINGAIVTIILMGFLIYMLLFK